MLKIGFLKDNLIRNKIAFTPNSAEVIVIGRDPKCEKSFPEIKNISAQHAQLIHDQNGNLYIVDLNSTNGVFINNNRIAPGVQILLHKTDDVRFSGIGGIKLTFNPDDYSTKPGTGPSPILHHNLFYLLNRKSKITLGRNKDNDVCLDNPVVSSHHAEIEKRGEDKYLLTDANSLNGIYVNGKKVNGSVYITEHDVIIIGRFKLTLKGQAKDLSKEVAIRAERIVKIFKGGKVGLHESSFEIPSKSLLAVMGPSGCGKSTLLKALNGDAPPSSGKVYISGLSLSENFDYIKTHIGYVPQDDIVHKELTVEQSLFYAAKLRLENASSDFIKQKIDQVLRQLKIEAIRGSLVGKISGGQRKRVSIAVEILTDPLILFLDEPTSPLDPQTVKECLEILKDLTVKGTTVIMVTHKPEDLNYMDDVIFMSEGGHIVYHASKNNYLNYFGVPDTVTVYTELVDTKAKKWITKHQQSHPNNSKSNSNSDIGRTFNHANFFLQYWWLTIRYFNIKLNDSINSLFMVGQAPIIAGLICLIFSSVTQAVPFLMAVSAVWFGANNAAREIVGETPIYKRERMFNQGILAYILSKVTVLSSFAALQSLLFTLIIYLNFSDSNPEWNDPVSTFLWMMMISIGATMMGLLISSLVTTTEKVMTLVPIVLIPQIMLAGVVAKIESPFVELLSYLMLSRWGTEGFSIIQKDVSAEIQVPQIDGSQVTEKITVNAIDQLKNSFHSSYSDRFGSWHGTMDLDLVAVLFITIACFIGIYVALKLKDPIKIR